MMTAVLVFGILNLAATGYLIFKLYGSPKDDNKTKKLKRRAEVKTSDLLDAIDRYNGGIDDGNY